MQHNIGHAVQHNIVYGMQHNIVYAVQHNIVHAVQHNLVYGMQHNLVDNISYIVKNKMVSTIHAIPISLNIFIIKWGIISWNLTLFFFFKYFHS